ncbi:MAG: hypothetical protein HYV96_04020 [Opitutae bacterium]|nr:hypothetical protein [Opitutae bacterium]
MIPRISTLAAAWAALVATAFALDATPSTTEGPYYTFNSGQTLDTSWLVGADNDLTLVTGKTTRASGTRFLLSGTLVNTAGTAISGATIELWQADNGGVYYYNTSAGNNTANRDSNFQSYGTCVTDSSGNWSFRTVHPGLYTGRIRHFHFKVNINGSTVLTSQFMFATDSASFSSDGVASPLVAAGTMSLVTLTVSSGIDSVDNATAEIAAKQIVVNVSTTSSSSGTTTTTGTSGTSTTTTTTTTSSTSSTGTSSGGGGGSPTLWAALALATAVAGRAAVKRKR